MTTKKTIKNPSPAEGRDNRYQNNASFFFRLLSILRHQGYLPFDKTGDWFYHLVEIMSMASVVLLMYSIFGPLVSTYNEKHDKFGAYNIPAEFGALYAIVPCIIIAIIVVVINTKTIYVFKKLAKPFEILIELNSCIQ